MTKSFEFKILAQEKNARCGEIRTPRGIIRTPAFMPVGTAGTVKGMYMDQVQDLGSDIILGNTYHLMLRPGAERVAKLGGLHNFIGWKKPILTDSGGFQVMSLSGLRKITTEGVIFRSHLDGSTHQLSPERAIEIQMLLGSDICMQLDECIALPATYEKMERAMELSLEWAERSFSCFKKQEGKAMFGIVQGGNEPCLRWRSVHCLSAMDLPGYAIGGLAVGETQDVMLEVLDIVCEELPVKKPRYLMGVGTLDDIVKAVLRGVDMFDCVMPTRAGRHGLAFTRSEKINLRNACYAEDMRPLDETSNCPAARDYSRAYLHHLVKSGESLGGMLLSWNNLSCYQNLMHDIRSSLMQGSFTSFAEQFFDQAQKEKKR